MGQDKALLDLGGVPAWQRSVERMSRLTPDVWLAPGTPGRLGSTGLREVPDENLGPAGAIVAALSLCPTPLLAVVAVDMPFAEASVFTFLAGKDRGAGAIPVWDSQPQPLHGVYRSETAGQMTALVQAGERSAQRLAAHLSVELVPEDQLRAVDPTGLFCVNINTPANLLHARTLINKGL